MRYDGRWRDRDPSEAPAGVKPVIRLQAPPEGETVVEDAVQGRVVWQNKDLDDLVLLRSDGTPTYMLAVVVDDHDMDVTHVIRGDDHLTNGARQTQIYQALGWQVPSMAHIPLIHGPDGAKLSKRHGALGVEAYRTHGLPAGGVAQLSGAPRLEPRRPGNLLHRGDDRGLRSRPASAARRRASISPSSRTSTAITCADRRRGIRRGDRGILPGDRAAARPRPHLRPRLCVQSSLAAMPGLKERAKTLVELLDSAYYLYAAAAAALDDKAAGLLADGRARLAELLEQARSRLRTGTPPASRRWCATTRRRSGAKLGQVAQPLRAALTGRATSPGLFDVMAVLGRDESLARLRDQIERCARCIAWRARRPFGSACPAPYG